MRKFEYKLANENYTHLVELLNLWGREGWELCHYENGSKGRIFILKREVIDKPQHEDIKGYALDSMTVERAYQIVAEQQQIKKQENLLNQR